MSNEAPVALVVGASMGIGQAICGFLADEGYDVACAARTASKLERTAELVRAKGRRAVVAPCDVRDEAAVKATVAKAVSELGRLDVVVIASGGPLAGVSFEKPKENDAFFGLMDGYTTQKIQQQDFDAIFDINFTGAKYCIDAAVRIMQEQGKGRIVVVTSKAGKSREMIVPGMVPYAAAKAALNRYIEGVAFELMCMESEVAINAMNPGMVLASMHEELPAEEKEGFAKPEDTRDVFFAALEGESGEFYSPGSLKTWAEEDAEAH